MRYRGIASFVLLVIYGLSFSNPAFAVGSSGFENASYSAYALSRSNAVVAEPEEPAAISYNPAGIADLKGVQAQTNLSSNLISTRMSHHGAIEQSSTSIIPVPTGYFTVNPGAAFNDRIAFGIGSDSPFGLSNKYDANLSGVRYTGWKNWLNMYTLKPTVAVKVTDWFSIGAGAMNYRVFDFGGIQAYPDLATSQPDGQIRLNMSGNAWGWHFGTLLKILKKHQLGFYLRSPVNIKLKGQAKVENSGVLAAAGAKNRHFITGVNADLDLPMNMTAAYAYKITERDTIELDLGYTRWGTHERLYIHADPVDTPNDSILAAIGAGSGNDKNYRDSFSIHLGGRHKFNEKSYVSAGTLFYTAAVPKTHFTPAVPDSNRLGFSIGTGYQICKYFKIDASYLFMLGLRRHINNSVSEALGTSVDGKYTTTYHVFSITGTFLWEDIFHKYAESKKETSEDVAPPSPLLTE